MTIWLACADGFIQADVIRWQEGIWERRGPKGARSMKIGDREVIAEVIDGPQSTPEGGCGWEVGIPEVSPRPGVVEARQKLDAAKKKQRL